MHSFPFAFPIYKMIIHGEIIPPFLPDTSIYHVVVGKQRVLCNILAFLNLQKNIKYLSLISLTCQHLTWSIRISQIITETWAAYTADMYFNTKLETIFNNS